MSQKSYGCFKVCLSDALEAESGIREIVGPETPGTGLRYLRFGLVNLIEGERRDLAFEPDEAVLVVLGGKADVIWGEGAHSQRIGERDNVFEGPAWAVYSPPGVSLALRGASRSTEIAVIRARPVEETTGGRADGGRQVEIVSPDMVKIRPVGTGNWYRLVHDIVVQEDQPQATRLIVGETFNPQGNWSSYPPHKHDEEVEGLEGVLEEVYHFRVKPSRGFGFQRIYSPSRGVDEAYVIRDGDTVAIPFGYHPVAAAPRYEVYYLWALAGEKRFMSPREDDAHAWVKNA
ncbi:MAG: 5-deoxy-glucuronate isomerase [Firmicutes bacterium]|jgi:5-deoxy-glucuronate isomerase|nr:5-deoxy-glucuronate isomerase [Bacillota bacterium]